MRKLQIKFPNQIRISGWDFGSSARAMNQAGGKDELMTYESVSFAQADLEKVSKSTTERKSMSTKTSIKRIALVAVSALGFGMLSAVAPANAAWPTTASLGTATANVAVVGQTSTITVPITISAAANATDSMTIAVLPSAWPASSAVDAGSDITAVAGSAVTASGSYAGAGTWASSIAASNEMTFTLSAAPSSTSYPISTSATFTFTPDVAGSYTFAYFTDGSTTVSPTGAIKTGDTVKYITVTALTAPAAKVALSQQLAGTGSSTGTAGLWVRVAATDAAGVVTRLASSQLLMLTIPTGLTLAAKNNGSTTTSGLSVTAADYGLAASDFNASGYAWVNFTGTAGTKALSAKISDGSVSSSLSLVYAATAGTPVVCAVGTAGNPDGSDIPASSNVVSSGGITASTTAISVSSTETSSSFTVCDNAASAVSAVSITDTDKTIFGNATALTQEIAVTVGATANDSTATDGTASLYSATFSIAHAALGYKSNTTTNKSLTITPSGLAASTVTGVASAIGSGSVTIKPGTSIQVVNGGSLTITATFADQYGNAKVGSAITAQVTAGRNLQATATNLVTDADGSVTFTVTDAAPTSTTLTDTVTFSGGASSGNTVTITYVSALTASTLTTSPSATTANTADKALDFGAVDSSGTASAGADSITATAKDANGVAIAGLPVTLTLPAGVSLKSTSTLVAYTNSSGVASWSVYTTKAGTYAFTFTGGGLTKTSYAKWTAGTARVVSVTAGAASNGATPVTIKVTDANGN